MANLEYVDFQPYRWLAKDGAIVTEKDSMLRRFSQLPQIFWATGAGWPEANHWALGKIEAGAKPETVKGLMKHLYAYANFLEAHQLDWRHFPTRLAERSIVRFRGELMSCIQLGTLASSTARSRMSALIQFYRYADLHNFVSSTTPMWRERLVVISYHDAVGFKRSLRQMTTDLAIQNRARHGLTLEDGLVPLSQVHMRELLNFTLSEHTHELNLMLTIGFFTGARLGTITTLRIENLEQARPDPSMKGFFLVRVGPGTGVTTKFDVEGDLLVPSFLLESLRKYAFSTSRIKREVRAASKQKSVLFLSKRGNPYSINTVSRLMTGLRHSAKRVGLKFMTRFKFHQTRATYGTWLMQLALGVTTTSAAIEFVKCAMFHKHESTTFRYVKFIESSIGKEEAAEAFNVAFTGLMKRDWNLFSA